MNNSFFSVGALINGEVINVTHTKQIQKNPRRKSNDTSIIIGFGFICPN